MFVTVSKADVDATNKPINTEKATSMFFNVMGFLLASMSVSEMATKRYTLVAVSEMVTPN